jgi:tetratricopeptide (TPR) repeat protein
VTTLPKKHQAPSTAELKARIERTRREGKYQQALDLVKQLHKAEPTPDHFELLKDTYFHRAAQLRGQGYLRDAATVLEVAARLDEKNPAWIQKLAAEMARCGEVARTLTLTARLPDEARAPLMGSLVDGAIFQGKAGRDALPAPLQAEYDLVLKAFAEVEAGQDEPARETLNGIGLRSPFLEWKLLLRGFLAYYHNDDDRARDNWQRLAVDRLPARLAAPFRAAIDPAYRDAQQPQTRTLLAQMHEQMQGGVSDNGLKQIRANLSNPDTATRAYRDAERIYPQLQQEAPHAAARLARCFYWSLVETGPDDIPRYRRVFGHPPEDRDFHRIQAIAFQRHGSLKSANEHWERYEKEIAQHPEQWPGEQANLARALVWLEMADNAANLPSEKQMKKMPGLMRMMQGMVQPLKPTAEECYQKSLELAPRLLEAHEGLFHHQVIQEQDARAIKAAEKLLEVFPDHVKTLAELSGMYLTRGKPGESIPLLERALKHNPLSRELRQHMQVAQSARARQLAEKGKFEEARPHFQAALDFSEQRELCEAYCQYAACEMKAGDAARADELLGQARARAPGELLITYNLLVESNRLALGHATKTRYTKTFNSDITGAGTPELAIALVHSVRRLDELGVSYHGQATHSKKIFEFANRIDRKQYSQAQMQMLLGDMVRLEPPRRMLRKMIDDARIAYPDNPFFAYFDLIYMMGDDPENSDMNSWRLLPFIDRIEEKARKWPADAQLEEMLADLRHRRQTLRALDALSNPFRMFGGGPFGFFDGFDDFEDDFDE